VSPFFLCAAVNTNLSCISGKPTNFRNSDKTVAIEPHSSVKPVSKVWGEASLLTPRQQQLPTNYSYKVIARKFLSKRASR
jgi:hypothetical protein